MDLEFIIEAIVLSIDPKDFKTLHFQSDPFQIQTRWQQIQCSIFEIFCAMHEVSE